MGHLPCPFAICSIITDLLISCPLPMKILLSTAKNHSTKMSFIKMSFTKIYFNNQNVNVNNYLLEIANCVVV